MERISMRDVASLAKVSIGTVSNVLNNPDRVSPTTRQRVEAAIDELGWVPNLQARQLRAGQGRIIGLAMLDVTNPFFADVLRGARAVLEDRGYIATIGDADNSPARQSSILRTFLEQRVRGVILSPVGDPIEQMNELARVGIPTVLADRTVAGVDACTVGVDDVAGGRLAAEHLITQGHRAIAFVGGPSTLVQVRDRREGAQQAADDAGATLLAVSTPSLDFGSGRRAAEELAVLPATERPTGVFCANDLVAIGLLQGLVTNGMRVPHDVAIVGYDDIDFAAAAAVPLSSVAQPRRDLGTAAAELLLAEIADRDAGRPHTHRTVDFSPQLVVRASSARRS